MNYFICVSMWDRTRRGEYHSLLKKIPQWNHDFAAATTTASAAAAAAAVAGFFLKLIRFHDRQVNFDVA